MADIGTVMNALTSCRTGYLGKSYVMRVAGFVRNRMRYRRLGGSSGILQTQLHKPLTATVQRADTSDAMNGAKG